MKSPKGISVISPKKDADHLGYREKRAVYKCIHQDLFEDDQGRIGGAKEQILESVEEIDLHTHKAPEGDAKE